MFFKWHYIFLQINSIYKDKIAIRFLKTFLFDFSCLWILVSWIPYSQRDIFPLYFSCYKTGYTYKISSHFNFFIIILLAFMQIKIPCYFHSFRKLCLINGLELGQFRQDLRVFLIPWIQLNHFALSLYFIRCLFILKVMSLAFALITQGI